MYRVGTFAKLTVTLSMALTVVPKAVAAADQSSLDASSPSELVMQGAPVILTTGIQAEIAKNKQSIEDLGYVQRPAEQSQANFALSRIKEREESAAEAVRATGMQVSSERRGFYRIGVDAAPRLPFTPSPIPEGLLDSDSTNYLLPLPHQVTRIYTKTRLGTLLVREIENATLYAEVPDGQMSHVGGFPVHQVTVKYANNQWATFILANKGNRIIQIEVGSRITSAKQRASLDSLVENVLADGN